MITDPPYGVNLKAKRTHLPSGGVRVRPGHYGHDDTPEYVSSVVIPAIELCRKFANVVVVTPGTRCLHLYPQGDDIGCFYSGGSTGLGRWGFTCMSPILYYGKDPYLSRGMGARPNSQIPRGDHGDANKHDHPCSKPPSWMKWLVNRASFEGQTVCDPFMGSGTTGIACIGGNRKFIGIEKDPKFFEVARKRIDTALRQGKLSL